jgi:hypothetical protein
MILLHTHNADAHDIAQYAHCPMPLDMIMLPMRNADGLDAV